jgi:putative transposase
MLAMEMAKSPEPRGAQNPFSIVVEPFLQQAGLSFAEVLTAEAIEQAFAQNDALFGQRDIFSTPIVLWAFLAQVLRDGKGAACAAAVADIATYCQQRGLPVPSGDTGDYCRARAKLSTAALRRLVGEAAEDLERGAEREWLWRGLHPKLVDGFTFTMMDTPANQRAFPQAKTQVPGVGLPIARVCAIVSLTTAAIQDIAVGPYAGKETGETALLRALLDDFRPGDLVVVDRYFCSYLMLALLGGRGAEVCTRLHQCRSSDFRRGRRLGDHDHLVTWRRPARPAWMSEDLYAQISQTLTLRELQFLVTEPGYRPKVITVITTLTDPVAYPKQEIATLFGYRWNVELDIRVIKQTLRLDHVLCKSPAMVLRNLWVTLLAYNLIRKLIATAAAEHGKQPRQLGFTLACQTVLASWMLLATGACRDACSLWKHALARIAANEVACRPGRIEPRVLKRRRHRYPLMQRPRQQLRQELAKT